MIVGEKFVWLHLGKTGGKTMRTLISLIEDEKLTKIFGFPEHHNNISQHEKKYGVQINKDINIVIGFRKLIPWMQSFHMQQFGKLDGFRELAIKGKLKFRNGKILSPDEILNIYINEENLHRTSFIRIEHMYEDFKKIFKNNKFSDQRAKEITSIKMGKKNYDKIKFTESEINKIYELNPFWQRIEKEIYP